MTQPPDVIVVGGGVIGCAVTYELAKRSVNVWLMDKSLPGRATSASAGGLWPVGESVGLGCGVIFHASQTASNSQNSETSAYPESLPDTFREFLVKSNSLFPELSEELRELSGIDIEYEMGAGLIYAIYNEQEQAFVEHVSKHLPSATSFQILSSEDVFRLEPQLTRELIGGALLSNEYQVNPMALAEAYKRAAIYLGATFRHDTRITGLRREGNQITGVEVGSEFYPCGMVVNAAGSWAGRLGETCGIKIPVFPVRGQVVLTETLPHTLNACLSTSACYLAQKKHGEVLIGSTTEQVGFDVSVTDDAIRSLCRGAIRAVPMLERVNVKRVWAGLRPGTPDELPILGPVDGLKGYMNATGAFRTGIVASPLTGQVVAQLATSQTDVHDANPFLSSRFVENITAELT